MAERRVVKLVKDSDNEIVWRVFSGNTTTQITTATSCTLALLDQTGASAGAALNGTYSATATLDEDDDVTGGWVFAVPANYLDSEGTYTATATIVSGGKTRVHKFKGYVSDEV